MFHATDIGFVVTVVKNAYWDPNGQVHEDMIRTVIPSLAYVVSAEKAGGCMTG
jgi:hypothetical protein